MVRLWHELGQSFAMLKRAPALAAAPILFMLTVYLIFGVAVLAMLPLGVGVEAGRTNAAVMIVAIILAALVLSIVNTLLQSAYVAGYAQMLLEALDNKRPGRAAFMQGVRRWIWHVLLILVLIMAYTMAWYIIVYIMLFIAVMVGGLIAMAASAAGEAAMVAIVVIGLTLVVAIVLCAAIVIVTPAIFIIPTMALEGVPSWTAFALAFRRCWERPWPRIGTASIGMVAFAIVYALFILFFVSTYATEPSTPSTAATALGIGGMVVFMLLFALLVQVLFVILPFRVHRAISGESVADRTRPPRSA